MGGRYRRGKMQHRGLPPSFEDRLRERKSLKGPEEELGCISTFHKAYIGSQGPEKRPQEEKGFGGLLPVSPRRGVRDQRWCEGLERKEKWPRLALIIGLPGSKESVLKNGGGKGFTFSLNNHLRDDVRERVLPLSLPGGGLGKKTGRRPEGLPKGRVIYLPLWVEPEVRGKNHNQEFGRTLPLIQDA